MESIAFLVKFRRFAAILLGLLPGVVMPLCEAKQVVGWVEMVSVWPSGLGFRAKIDTGARHSSINASNIEAFERDGETWLRFEIVNHKEKKITLERPMYREAKIQRHFGRRQVRPVVRLGLCLGDLYKEVQVNLVDRTGFTHPLLLGRSFMKDQVMVDPSAQYTVKPNCPEARENG
jgi:hypothetical protein